ncbi:protein kinase [Streptomyces sp. MS1.AVA.1]|uniref:non-specific serine/threonine protein kinase n=1 Tax=Streptomyces machairae TaxID=3134109 RepID=A0ABU8UU19_9ACTN
MAGERERIIAGRYRLRQRLGAGGGGSVWLAEDEKLRAQVAVKEIDVPDEPDERLGDPADRGRDEALKAAQLREHPNVITVYDVVEDDDRPWIVMEYLPGTRDLHAVARQRGPLSSEETARIGAAALDGLRAGHRLGIIHRDVKPSNILLAPDHSGTVDGRVLLTDYGISLRPRETRITRSGMVVGTPGYVAPERLSGGEATAASDLFSLGVTLYFAVEGTAPFERDTLDASLLAALNTEPSVPQRASAPLSRAIMGLLAKDPLKRIQAAEAAELLAEAAGEAVGTPGSRPGQPAPPDEGSSTSTRRTPLSSLPTQVRLAARPPGAHRPAGRERRVRAGCRHLRRRGRGDAEPGGQGEARRDSFPGPVPDRHPQHVPVWQTGGPARRPHGGPARRRRMEGRRLQGAAGPQARRLSRRRPRGAGHRDRHGRPHRTRTGREVRTGRVHPAHRKPAGHDARPRAVRPDPRGRPERAAGVGLPAVPEERHRRRPARRLPQVRRRGVHHAAGPGRLHQLRGRRGRFVHRDPGELRRAARRAGGRLDLGLREGSSDSVDTGGLCEEKYGVDWARGKAHEMWGWSSTDEEWDAGFRHVMCSVAREDGKKLPAGGLKPAY